MIAHKNIKVGEVLKILALLAFMLPTLSPITLRAQKLIEYTSGMGARDPHNADIWILYGGVTMTHDGMILEADSAHYDTRQNNFSAFGNVDITLSDTTFIFGSQLFYNSDSRVLDIYDDTVILVDGEVILRANHLTYERNQATAYYTLWGYAVGDGKRLSSRQGQYNSDLKEFYIYNEVQLTDSSMLLLTDTLVYNTTTHIAHFESPTRIYSDSSTVYSELGDYNTDTKYAASYKASHASSKHSSVSGDTLYYDQILDFGQAYGNVCIVDSTNNLTCTGRRGETNRRDHYSYVTDSALVVYVTDSLPLYIHADTIFVTNDSLQQVETIRACHDVKAYRSDVQASCDSVFYSATDSTLTLYIDPVLWYDHYQLTADTIIAEIDSNGLKQVHLQASCMALQQVDRERFNQIQGKRGEIYFQKGELKYADIVGNARSVFYITEQSAIDGQTQLVGVNAGVGSSMRIYFDSTHAASRVVTYDKPDMHTYPVTDLPADLQHMEGFRWLNARRPQSPAEVFPEGMRPPESKINKETQNNNESQQLQPALPMKETLQLPTLR